MEEPARTNGRIDLQLAVPRELGGPGGEGTNPEQLFAAGYAACFLGAVEVAGQHLKVRIPPEAAVTATVGIGPRSEGGLGITAELGLHLPGTDPAQARQVADLAHQICPYSNATRNKMLASTSFDLNQTGCRSMYVWTGNSCHSLLRRTS